MDDLYREIIIERYKTPHYRGHLDPHDIFFEDDNPTCGDHIEITVQVGDDGIVKAANFDGHGCSITQASADLLIESIHGKPLEVDLFFTTSRPFWPYTLVRSRGFFAIASVQNR